MKRVPLFLFLILVPLALAGPISVESGGAPKLPGIDVGNSAFVVGPDGTITLSSPMALVGAATSSFAACNAVAPPNGTRGMWWYDTTTNTMKFCNGSQWVAARGSETLIHASFGAMDSSSTNVWRIGRFIDSPFTITNVELAVGANDPTDGGGTVLWEFAQTAPDAGLNVCHAQLSCADLASPYFIQIAATNDAGTGCALAVDAGVLMRARVWTCPSLTILGLQVNGEWR